MLDNGLLLGCLEAFFDIIRYILGEYEGMDKKEFKKTLALVLEEYGFETKNNIAKAETEELIVVIATQKSNFENNYYLNFGFLIKKLNPELKTPKDNQCDLFGRLNLDIAGELSTSVDYERISCDEFH